MTPTVRKIFSTFPFSSAWSALDEATKKRIPGRRCFARDIRLNLSGTALGAALWLLTRIRR